MARSPISHCPLFLCARSACAQCRVAPRRYTLSYHLYPLQRRDSSTTDRTGATLATTRAQWRGHVRADVLMLLNCRGIGFNCKPSREQFSLCRDPTTLLHDYALCVKSNYQGRSRTRQNVETALRPRHGSKSHRSIFLAGVFQNEQFVCRHYGFLPDTISGARRVD